MRIRFLVYLLPVVFLLAGCKKDDATHGNTTPYSVPKDNLVAELRTEVYNPTELTSTITNGPIFHFYLDNESYIKAFEVAFQVVKNNRLFILDTTFAHRKILVGYKRNWAIESHIFTYKTISAKGEPITLSARVSFPNSSEGKPHQVQSLSLCTHFLLHEHSQAPSIEPSPYVMRTLYNSAVIEPDYEGYGLTADMPYPGFNFEVLGQQALDCARAALKVMENHGVTFNPKGHSTVWGYSLGTPNAMSVVKYYDTKLPQDEKDNIRLNAGFMGCGPLMLRDMVEYFDQNPDYSATGLAYLPSFLAAMPQSAFNGYNYSDFLPSWMKTHTITVEGKDMLFLEAMQQNKLTWFERPSEHPYSMLKENLAEDMCTPDGHLDYSNPKTVIILNLIQQLSSWDNWTPQEDIYLTHCKDDDVIPYYQTEVFYNNKKNEPKLHFKDVSSKPLDAIVGVHAASTAMDIIISILHEDPAEAYKYLF